MHEPEPVGRVRAGRIDPPKPDQPKNPYAPAERC